MSAERLAGGAAPPGSRTAPGRQLPARARPGRGWVMIRVTGLLLSVLVLGHLLAVHLLTDVARTTSSFVLRRWSSALWVGWDGCMLTAGVAHGAAGIWAVTRDHLRPGAGRRAAGAALWLAGIVLTALGWWTIATVVVSAAAG